MTALADIVEGAKFRADLSNSDRVSDPEWATLANEAVLHAWKLAASARPDFQIASQDFVVASGSSASFTVPANFFGLIDVVYSPDTASEYSLGPFMWANRRSPGGWCLATPSASGGTSVRLMGTTVYIEPAMRAGGTYRLWYCPKPTAFAPIIMLRLFSTLNLVGSWGIGFYSNTYVNAINGALVIDGTSAAVGDLVALNGEGLFVNNGLYRVTNAGSAGTAAALTREAGYRDASKLTAPIYVQATEGGANADITFALDANATVGTDDITFSDIGSYLAISLDPILDSFVELLRVKTALPAVLRDDDLDPRPLQTDLQRLEAELQSYFRQVRNSNGPQKMIDTDARGPRVWSGW